MPQPSPRLNYEPVLTPAQARAEMQPALLSAGPEQPSASELIQWWEELHSWVAGFRVRYHHHVGSGWPLCWFRHQGLVEFLALARAKEASLARNAPNLSDTEALHWMDIVESVARAAYRVTRQCRNDTHQPVSAARSEKSDAEFRTWLATAGRGVQRQAGQ